MTPLGRRLSALSPTAGLREPPPTAASAELLAAAVAAGAAGDLLRGLWLSPLPVVLQDADHRIAAANDAFVQFAGRPRSVLVGLDPVQLMPAEDRPMHLAARAAAPTDERTASRSAVQATERRLLDGQGAPRWYRATASEAVFDDGRRCAATVLQDTTHAHRADDQVERSMRELEQWFALSPVGMAMYDRQGLIVRHNPAFENLVGRVPTALPDGEGALRELLGWETAGPHPGLSPQAPPLERAVALVAADGRRRLLRARVRAIEPGAGEHRYLAVVEDRSAEDERDLARLEMGALMDTAGVGVATFEASHGWRQSTPSRRGSAAVAGAAGLQSISRDVVDPGSMPEYDRLQLALKRGERAEVRYAVRHPDLGLRWLLTRVEPGQLGFGRPTTSVVTLDVTEQEQARLRNEQLLRELGTILDGTSAGIAYLRGHVLVRCNRRFERMLDLAGGEAAGASFDRLFEQHPTLLLLVQNGLAELRGSSVAEAEFALGGQWYSLSLRRASGTDHAPVAEAVAVLTDITRLKSQQAELENLLREREVMFSLSEVGIAWVRHGRISRANEAFAQLTGHAPAELPTLDHAELFEDRAAWLAWQDREEPRLLAEGRLEGERWLRRRDGSLLWVQVHHRLVNEADPDAGRIVSYVNVDERHRARQALQLQAERTRAILDSVLVGIVTVGEGGIEWMNRSARRMFGGELADFVGEPIATVATPEDEHPLRRTHYLRDLAEGHAEAFECQLRGRDGRQFWVVGNVVATSRDAAGGRQLTFALLDIERRRQAEAAQRAAEEARFEAAIQQRDMLVKEVHHRIKNNLQGVAGLMQQIARRKPEVAPVISEAVGQIQAIAQVYGLQVGIAGPLRVKSLLEAITGSVQRMFGRTIVLAVEGEAPHRWALPEAESIPIALTLNELLTNAVKHSASVAEPGDVRCTLVCEEACVRVTVANHGRLPAGFELAKVPGGVSGLGLVRALLPRRTAVLALTQDGDSVVASIVLTPPGVTQLEAL